MSETAQLKNYREVGHFDLLVTPTTPVNTVNSPELNALLEEMLKQGHTRIVIDLSTVEFLYSDTLSVLSRHMMQFQKAGGALGVLTEELDIIHSIKLAQLDKILLLFHTEPEILTAGIEAKGNAKKSENSEITEVVAESDLSLNSPKKAGAEENPKVEGPALQKRKVRKKKKSPPLSKKAQQRQLLLKLLLIPVVMILILWVVLFFYKPELFNAILSGVSAPQTRA